MKDKTARPDYPKLARELTIKFAELSPKLRMKLNAQKAAVVKAETPAKGKGKGKTESPPSVTPNAIIPMPSKNRLRSQLAKEIHELFHTRD